jgi:hypothetical protein
MMFQRQMSERAKRVAREARATVPFVIGITFELRENHEGEPSIFFKILIADEVATAERIGEGTRPVIAYLQEQMDAAELGYNVYTNFRSASEQRRLKDPQWPLPKDILDAAAKSTPEATQV